MNVEDIKFKAWDKINKQMIQPEDIKYISFNSDGLSYVETYLENDRGHVLLFDSFDCENNDIILLPFTGFKDKKGTEIYEGDILKFHCQKQLILKVGYEGGGFDLRDENNEIIHDLYDLVDGALDYKPLIIGNIWENPELLKEESSDQT